MYYNITDITIMENNEYKWILLMYSLPLKPSRQRVSIWRMLKKIGSVALKKSVYILPYTTDLYERFQWLSQEITSTNGEATLVKVRSIENMSDSEIRESFNKARDEEYSLTIQACSRLSDKLGRIKGADGEIKSLRLEAKKIGERLEEIKHIDFFGASRRTEAIKHYGLCLKKLDKLSKESTEKPVAKKPAAEVLNKEHYIHKKWITRARPHVDRIASAWLIKRFIDMDAEFAFASNVGAGLALPNNKGAASSAPTEIPFDMVGVEFTHHGEDCTFETIVKRFGIKDRAVHEIAEIVHEIDLKDGRYERHESRGIDSILRGLLNVYKDDQELLKAGFMVFEALYSSIRKTKTQKI